MAETRELTERDRIPVYAALLASDNAATALVMQVTVSLTVACATYLTASLVVLNQTSLAPGIIALIPIPVYLMQTYQLVLASSVRRRTESTREIEGKLVRLAGLHEEYRDAFRIGSRATEAATDPHLIMRAPGNGTITRYMASLAAVLPYLGFYALGIGYSSYIIGFVLRDQDVWWWWMVATAFGLGWILFAVVSWHTMVAALPDEVTATDPCREDSTSPQMTSSDELLQTSVDEAVAVGGGSVDSARRP